MQSIGLTHVERFELWRLRRELVARYGTELLFNRYDPREPAIPKEPPWWREVAVTLFWCALAAAAIWTLGRP